MAIPDVAGRTSLTPLFPEETEDVIRERWAAWANEGVSVNDESAWVDTREGSMFFILTAPGVREVARLYDLMGSEFVSAGIPFWSWGEYLDSHAASVDEERSPATAAGGEVTFFGPNAAVVPAGTRVGAETVEPGGASEPREYQTLQGGTIGINRDPPLWPGTPTTVSSGGALSPSTTYYVVTTLTAEGESPPSTEVSATTAASVNFTINVDWTAPPALPAIASIEP